MPSSYSLGRHFERFIDRLVRSGRYASASEVMRDSMRLLEQREQLREVKLEALRAEKQASTAALPGRSTWRRTRPKPARNEAPRAMPAEILWPPQARLDLIEIWNDIADDDEAAADRMLDRIDGILRMLSERPKAGRERTGACLGLRSFRPNLASMRDGLGVLVVYSSSDVPMMPKLAGRAHAVRCGHHENWTQSFFSDRILLKTTRSCHGHKRADRPHCHFSRKLRKSRYRGRYRSGIRPGLRSAPGGIYQTPSSGNRWAFR
jgi:antitoxin ParD1/3/4